jgi:hypothetical protein
MVFHIEDLRNICHGSILSLEWTKPRILTLIWADNGNCSLSRVDSIKLVCMTVAVVITFVINVDFVQV